MTNSIAVHSLIAAFLLTQVLPAKGADWPRFLGPEADNTSPETNLLDRWPKKGPPVLWDKRVGTGYGAASVLGGRLVVHHRVGNQEAVECLKAETGETLWRHSYSSSFRDPYGYNNGPRCSPLLKEDRCYTFGADGMLSCVNLQNGDLLWEVDTALRWKVPEGFFGVGSNPLLWKDILLVIVGGQPDSGMVAFDAETGKVRWESVGKSNWQGEPMLGWRGERTVEWNGREKQASYAAPVVAEIHGESRLLAFMRQGLVLLNPEDGKVFDSFWHRATINESVNAANPIVAGNRVFISSAYYRTGSVLIKITPEDRFEELWRNRVLEIHWSTPVYYDGHLFAFSGRNEPDASFRCVEMETAQLKWERDESWYRTTRQPDVYGRGSLILADDKLIVLGEGGLLGLFEPDTKQPKEISRWQVPQLQYPCWAGPVLADGNLYLRAEEALVCLDISKNREK